MNTRNQTSRPASYMSYIFSVAFLAWFVPRLQHGTRGGTPYPLMDRGNYAFNTS